MIIIMETLFKNNFNDNINNDNNNKFIIFIAQNNKNMI